MTSYRLLLRPNLAPQLLFHVKANIAATVTPDAHPRLLQISKTCLIRMCHKSSFQEIAFQIPAVWRSQFIDVLQDSHVTGCFPSGLPRLSRLGRSHDADEGLLAALRSCSLPSRHVSVNKFRIPLCSCLYAPFGGKAGQASLWGRTAAERLSASVKLAQER